ncbi:MAG TPA: hypothetical protein VE172_06620 [Stackebrandtia sp.]|uniref:hypothetical protein n=1 Tax=Stackebrandtia sp. TaxID=2023065 RepID=UPI002D6780D2|nr:hypothetical protein [Stackebrandtia sp.]HZE38471.1 hypothetical protein [Stackebrandtia sp.]
MSIKRTAIALALGAGLALAPVGVAHAESIGVALSPPTAGPGTEVEIRVPNCTTAGSASVNGITITLTVEKKDDAAWGQYTVPSTMKPDDYTVTVHCGSQSADATLTVTSGSGAPAGGGATARTSAMPMVVGGGMVALGMVGAVVVMRRRRPRTATR